MESFSHIVSKLATNLNPHFTHIWFLAVGCITSNNRSRTNSRSNKSVFGWLKARPTSFCRDRAYPCSTSIMVKQSINSSYVSRACLRILPYKKITFKLESCLMAFVNFISCLFCLKHCVCTCSSQTPSSPNFSIHTYYDGMDACLLTWQVRW